MQEHLAQLIEQSPRGPHLIFARAILDSDARVPYNWIAKRPIIRWRPELAVGGPIERYILHLFIVTTPADQPCRFARHGMARAVAMSLIAVSLVLTSCSIYRPRKSAAPPVDLPERFSEASEIDAVLAQAQPSPDRWWEAFGDDKLNELILRGLSDNFSLRQAWARLDAAIALARIEGAARWPQLNLDAGAARDVRAVDYGGGYVSFRTRRKAVTPAASYEVDLWGKLRFGTAAARLEARAGRRDLDAAAMTLAANVADVYFAIIEQHARIDLINQQSEVNKTYLDLTKLRFGHGQASALDVYQQRQQAALVSAELPLVKSRLEVLEHQLAVLLGQTPDTDLGVGRAVLPDLPAAPPAGIPAELLKRRPDVRAAELRAVAADHRVAAAIADRFPSLRLNASMPFQAAHFSNVFRVFVWSISAGLSAPIVDGGRRRAEVDRTRAVVAERMNNYAAVLLAALQEVEDALVQERRQLAYLERVDEQVKIAHETLREARASYVNGLGDYLPVLTALRALQQLELLQLREKKRLLEHRIQLYRALGGSWMSELERAGTAAKPVAEDAGEEE